jgi:hypothetical protein
VRGAHGDLDARAGEGVGDAGGVSEEEDVVELEVALPVPAGEVVAVDVDAGGVDVEVVAAEEVIELVALPGGALVEGEEADGEVVGLGEDPADAVWEAPEVAADLAAPAVEGVL